MPAMKRPAAANAQPAKVAKVVKESPKVAAVRTQQVDPFAEKCKVVVAALRAATKGNETEMLISMLPLAAQPPPRHRFQESALDFVDQVLSHEHEEMKSKVVKSQASVAGIDDERARRVAAVAAAVADVEVKTSAHAEAKTFLANQCSVLKEAKTAAAAARAAQKTGDAELDTATERELVITTAIEQKAALEASDVADESEESNFKLRAEKLSKLCQPIIDDAGLLKAVAMSLGKLPQARAAFDKMVLTQFSEDLTKHLAATQKIITEGDAGKAARAAEVHKCDAAQASANDAQMTAMMAESDAEVAKAEAEASVTAAKEAEAGLEKEVEAAAADVLSTTQRIAEFEAGPMATFAALRVPPVEPEVAPAAAAAADEEKAVGDGEASDKPMPDAGVTVDIAPAAA